MSGGALDYFSCTDVIDKLTDVYITGKNEHSKETLEIRYKNCIKSFKLI